MTSSRGRDEIDAEIKGLEGEIVQMLGEVPAKPLPLRGHAHWRVFLFRGLRDSRLPKLFPANRKFTLLGDETRVAGVL